MNKNILIVMGGGLMVAILVAMLVKFGLSSNKQVVEEGKVEILVASRNIKIGEELSESNMKWASWPEGSVFGAAIRRKDGEQVPEDALEGKVARSIATDEPLLKSVVVKEDKGNFVAAVLPAGFRAVAISVKAENMVGGFITPGDFVDVILTYRVKFDDNDDPIAKMVIDQNIDEHATETILQNIKVMAIDQTSKSDDAQIKVGKTVTLQVDEVGAEKLALANEMGPLTLALRGLGDDKISTEKRKVATDLRITNISDQLWEEYRETIGGGRDKKDGKMSVPSSSVKIYNGSDVQSTSSR